MFQKLRNKFLILNMAIISVLLLGAFSVVYAFTYSNTQRDINFRLSRTLEFGQNPGFGQPPKDDGQAHSGRRMAPKGEETDHPQPPRLSTDFTLEVDGDGNILKINSTFEIDESIYQAVAAKVTASGKEAGQLKSEDTLWAFKKVQTETGSRIAFLDISAERHVLNVLILTFLGVGLLCLLMIFLISLFFANRAIRPIEDAWMKQKQFVADASHELKTPLTTINTNVDVLLSHSDDTIAGQEKWLYYIKGEAERMTKLTSDLLYLANLDHTGEKQELTASFSLSDAVQNVLLANEAALFERSIQVGEEIEPGLQLRGDEGQIRQLVLILLDNAMKYTGAEGRIAVSLKREEKHAVLRVSNTGEEIAPQDLHKIFDRFYRPDQSRARESGGYGLGLAIAKAITSRHNGKITVQSANSLTTFTVTLPLG